ILVRGRRGFHVGVPNARIDNLVFPVFVVVVLIELMCIVRRVAEDDEDRRGFLTLDAFRVLEVEEAKLGLCFFRSLERIYQAYAWERFIAPGLFPERVLNVYRSDVVRQQHYFVAVEFVLIFVLKPGLWEAAEDVNYEIAGANEWIYDVDTRIAKRPAKLSLQNLLHTVEHKIDNLLRRIDYA